MVVVNVDWMKGASCVVIWRNKHQNNLNAVLHMCQGHQHGGRIGVLVHSPKTYWNPGHDGCGNESIAVSRLGMFGTSDCDDTPESITAHDIFCACVELDTGDLMIAVSHARVSRSGNLTRPEHSHFHPFHWRPQLSPNSAADWCVHLYFITMGPQIYGNRFH